MSWAGFSWRKRGEDLYLATNCVFACHGHEVLLHEAVEDVTQGLESAKAWLQLPTQARGGVRLWLSGALCRPFVLAPVEGLKHGREAMEVARSQVAAATGLAEGPWEVWVDRFQPGAPIVGAAMAQPLHGALLHLANEVPGRRTWRSIRPWWAEVLRNRAASGSALSIQDTDSVTWLAGRGDTMEAAATYWSVTTSEQGESARARASMSAQGEPAGIQHWRLALDCPADSEATVPIALGPFAEVLA